MVKINTTTTQNNVATLRQLQLKIKAAKANLKAINNQILLSKNSNPTPQATSNNALAYILDNQETLINTTNDSIWVIDDNYCLIIGNIAFLDAFKNVFKIKLKIGDSVLHKKFEPALLKKWMAFYKRGLSGESFISNDEIYIENDKKKYFISYKFNPLRDSVGKVIGLACHTTNNTVFKNTLIEIQQTKAVLENIFTNSIDIICAINEKNIIINISKSVKDILGYNANDCIGKNILDYVYKGDIKKTISRVKDVMDGKNQKQFNNRYLHKNGSLVYLEWNSSWDQKAKIRYSIARNVTEKINIEFKLKQSEQLFKHLAENGSDIIVVLNGEGKFSYVRPTSFNKLGFTNEEMLKANVFDFIHPQDVKLLQQTLASILLQQKISLPQFRLKHKTQGWVWLEGVATNLINDPVINGIVVNAINITERKNIENCLLESNKNYKNLFENNPAPMFIWDLETKKIVDCNEEALLKYGYTKNEFTNLSIIDIRLSKYTSILKDDIKNEKEYGNINKNIWTYKNKNGDILFMEITAHLIDYKENRCSLVIAIDVTEKLQILQQSKISEEQYKLLFYSSPLPKIIYNLTDFSILDVNEASVRFYGYSRKFLLTLNVSNLINPSEYDKLKNKHKNIANKKELIHFGTYSYLKKNNKLILFEFSGNNLWYKNSNCILAVCVDTTKKVEAQNQLKLSERFLKEAQRIAKIGSWSFDIEHNIVSRSEQLNKIYGFTNNAKYKTYEAYLKLINKEHHYEIQEQGKNARLTGDSFYKQYTITTAKGTQKIIEEFGKGEKNSEGKIIRLYGTAQDVTDRIIAERKLTETIKRYEIVTKATNDAIWDWDLVANKIYWGNTYYKTFGKLNDNELSDVNKTRNRMHPDEIKNVFGSLGKAFLGTAKNWQSEHRYLKADKTYAYVTNKAIVVRDDNGIAIRVIGAMQDVTKQKQEEQRLKLMSSVVTNTSDVIIISEAEPLDGDGPKIIFVNEAFTTLTGYTAAEVIGKTPRILQGPKSDKSELERLSKSLKNWETFEATLINYKKNGEEFWINFSVSPVANDKGWFTHWIAIERDVTVQKNEELQKILFENLNSIFNEPISLTLIREKIMQAIVHFGDFCLAELWTFGADKNKIIRVASYTNSPLVKDFFEPLPHKKNLIKGEGLAGVAWQDNEIKIWDKNNDNINFARKQLALKVGLEKVFAIPLISDNEVNAVLLLASDTNQISDEKYTTFFNKLIQYLGPEIKRKQLERELNQIFNFAPDILVLASLDGYFKRINPAICVLLEYSEEELLAQPFVNFVHPNDREKTLDESKKLSKGIPTLHFENRYITKSGKTKWFAWTASVPSIQEGVMYAVARDITDKKALELSLFKTATIAKIGGWELDLVANNVHWDNITKEIHEVPLDYSPILDSAINFYKEGESRNAITNCVKDAIDYGKSWDNEFQIITYNKKTIWVRAIGEAEFLNNKCIRLYGTFQNIDDRKKSELELIELNENLKKQTKDLAISNQDLEQFAYVASHDLQEPLRMVTSFLTQLNKRYGNSLDDDAKEYIHFAVDGAKRMRQLILDLLEYSRAGKESKEKDNVNINSIINDIKIFFRNTIKITNATIENDNFPLVRSHKVPIMQILQNLIGNALKYCKPNVNPLINITYTQNKLEWQIAVKDNGIGIDEKYFDKIFVIFQRLHTRSEYSGTGMGLAVTKKIVESLGGKIWIESAEGQGTTFYFTIPKN